MSEARPEIPAASVVAVIAGLVAAWGIPGHPAGLNFVLTGVVTAAALVAHPRRVWWPAAAMSLLLVAFFALRAAKWLLALDLLVAAGLAAVAVVDARTWRALATLPLSLANAVLRGPLAVAAPLGARIGSWIPHEARPFVRGLAVATGLVSVFGGLFFSADAAFAHLTAQALMPDWNVTLFPARAIVLVGAFALAAAFVVLPAPTAASELPSPWRSKHRRLQRLEWGVALGALDLLFLAFVVIQITVLFGGRTHVLTTAGMTYAQYARQGFFQLLAVAVLVLGVIAWTVSRVDASHPRERLRLRVLLGVLCLLTLVVLASAFRRLELYEEAYGFTRLRISVHAAIVWIGAAFVLVLGAGAAWRAEWLPRTLVIVTGVGLVAFNVVNPDATIARENIARFERDRRIDTTYLASLSPDALPALMELPQETRACPVAVIAARLPRDNSPFAFNLSRDTAERVVAREDVAHGEKLWSCRP